MENFAIVIGRQYGAGGRKLGRLLADSLNIPYYDKELLAEAAKLRGLNPEIFTRTDEKRPSALRSLLSFCYGSESGSYSPYSLTDENIYKLQSQVIEALAIKSSCIIVGRTADYILRHHPRLISIFIHAPEQVRLNNILNRGEVCDRDEARNLLHKKDHQRECYYNYYTNRTWGRADNYDLCFDSSKLPVERICAILSDIITRPESTNNTSN